MRRPTRAHSTCLYSKNLPFMSSSRLFWKHYGNPNPKLPRNVSKSSSNRSNNNRFNSRLSNHLTIRGQCWTNLRHLSLSRNCGKHKPTLCLDLEYSVRNSSRPKLFKKELFSRWWTETINCLANHKPRVKVLDIRYTDMRTANLMTSNKLSSLQDTFSNSNLKLNNHQKVKEVPTSRRND